MYHFVTYEVDCHDSYAERDGAYDIQNPEEEDFTYSSEWNVYCNSSGGVRKVV